MSGDKTGQKSRSGLFDEFTLTPQQLVKRRHLLRVKEAAYCLHLSERKVQKMVQEGELIALRDHGVIRIRATDVEALMNDFDE